MRALTLLTRKIFKPKTFTQLLSTKAVLGIETSCDDTGAAVINCETHKVVGESLQGQQRLHTLHGGINPTAARQLHASNIERVVNDAMDQAGLEFKELQAIATTVTPGLTQSLEVGCSYGKRLSLEHRVPFIPIHHMEAHALTVRLTEQVEFPYLCLLASGGHCLLVLCLDINRYKILGQSHDDAPGEALDKGGRILNLRSIKSLQSMSGGAAIELLAREGDPNSYVIFKAPPMSKYRDCNFSFSAFKSALSAVVSRLEQEHGLDGDTALPHSVLCDVCASYQRAVMEHIIRRTHRALLYIQQMKLLPADQPKTMVLSGGVASNALLRSWMQRLCDEVTRGQEESYRVLCPPPKLCTDNGVMIAWNGVEKLRRDIGVLTEPSDIEQVQIAAKSPLGEDVSADISNLNIKINKKIKL